MVRSQPAPLTVILRKASILAALLGLVPILTAVETVLEPRRLHLGRVGQWEWESFKDVPVHAEQLELRFSAKPNHKEHTLRLWQRDVKLNWTVFLNGLKVGTLVTTETAMETLLPIPTGALKEGENVLLVKAPTALDDIEIGEVTLLDQST
ncbi:MAG TPA: beta galactosidase jelly roll domain-containing protein, partial [Verrucomicrobium sp.]|nr:beta galactosidase jelly roll domain-containing protein [Verrucomicrobium sp.]